jgi:TM2 domain-containing membrane protein YozV
LISVDIKKEFAIFAFTDINYTEGKEPLNMKKYILYPLCSAFIVPGLGQVLNKKILKGLILMVLVFILFIAITVNLAFLIISQLQDVQTADIEEVNNMIEKLFLQGDLSTFWVLLIISITLWLYSIIDAFFDGLKQERDRKENPDEILSN